MYSPLPGQKHHQLTDPPRMVPFSLRARVMLGGVGQVAWLCFGVAMIFFWAIGLRADLSGWTTFKGPLETAEGVVTSVKKTDHTEGGTKRRAGTPVYGHHYEFDTDGGTFRGVSYCKGQQFRISDDVIVEFPPGDPSRSRIQGMRAGIYGPDTLAIGVFPLVAVGFLVFTLWKGRQNCHLLQDGLLTTAKLINMEEKRGRKGSVSYKLTFEFQNAQGQLRHTSVTVSNPAYLTDEPREFVLYDPHHEWRAVLLDAMPGRPRIADDGTLHSTSPQWDMLSLLIPAAAILGNGWYLVKYVLT